MTPLEQRFEAGRPRLRRIPAVLSFSVDGGRITEIHAIRNPEKLRGVA